MQLKNEYKITIEQNLSYQQIQSLQLLEFCNLELEHFLAKEYDENPLLEIAEKERDLSNYKERSFNENNVNFENFVKAEENDHKSFIKMQIPYQQYTDEEILVMEYVIENLDSDGLFDLPLETVSASTKTSIDCVKHVLYELQKLEPAGIFCKNIKDCLSVQLKRKGLFDEICERILNNHFEDLLYHRYSLIQKEMRLSAYTLRKYTEIFQHLYEKPFDRIENSKLDWIIPDVVAMYVDGDWMIEINDDWMTNYRLNDYYVRLMKDSTDLVMKENYEKKRLRVNFLLTAIEQRRETIMRSVRAILEWQQSFFLKNEAKRPMTLQMIAEVVGVHESTISRVIQHKYLQANGKILSMKALFSKESSINDVSVDQIGRKIQQLIDSEDKAHPYSDQALSKCLLQQGLDVPRRTIAFYRKQLQIPESYKRKKDAL